MRARRIIELERGAVLPVPCPRGTSIACVGGAVWVTNDDDRNDVILEPGQALRLCGSGTLVYALHPARVAIEATGMAGIETVAATIKATCARLALRFRRAWPYTQ
jgi:hypothetical protein